MSNFTAQLTVRNYFDCHLPNVSGSDRTARPKVTANTQMKLRQIIFIVPTVVFRRLITFTTELRIRNELHLTTGPHHQQQQPTESFLGEGQRDPSGQQPTPSVNQSCTRSTETPRGK